MRHAMLALAALTISTGADAQRLDTTQMTCEQARAVVARSGAVVLGSGPYIYDRYVANGSFCSYGETTRQAFAATRDAAQCPVGDICVTRDSVIRFGD